ncbi:MAG: HEAT repeat domain-containing protein [Pirellulaceae bacterium]|nr:HEAT repeat domain-containing protein [Pirellulaceae bacterium]
MDTRNSKLIVALAGAMVLIVTGVTLFGLRQIKETAPERIKVENSQTHRRPRHKSPPNKLSEERLSKRRLRELLHQRGRDLQSRSAELRQQNLAYEKLLNNFTNLQSRFDELEQDSAQDTTLLVDLVTRMNENVEIDNQPSPPRLPDMQLIDMENEAANPQNAELTLIQWQLDVANERVRELENSILQEMVKSTEATRALIDGGEAVVESIADLLNDENAEIRLWAAEVLGKIGRPALNATDILIQAMSDPNQEVRKAAEAALDRIEGRS